MTTQTAPRALGSAPPPLQRFVAPLAVRLAQLTLLARIGIVVGILLAANGVAQPVVVIDGTHVIALPSGATWAALSPYLVAGSVLEGVLAMRLGVLGSYSRRLVLLVEALVIALSGLYVAAGESGMLVVMVGSIATVVLLRLAHVRHSFAKAAHERWLMGRRVTNHVYTGYEMPDPTAVRVPQGIGYRANGR